MIDACKRRLHHRDTLNREKVSRRDKQPSESSLACRRTLTTNMWLELRPRSQQRQATLLQDEHLVDGLLLKVLIVGTHLLLWIINTSNLLPGSNTHQQIVDIVVKLGCRRVFDARANRRRGAGRAEGQFARAGAGDGDGAADTFTF